MKFRTFALTLEETPCSLTVALYSSFLASRNLLFWTLCMNEVIQQVIFVDFSLSTTLSELTHVAAGVGTPFLSIREYSIV
jgi:hypothetical protein